MENQQHVRKPLPIVMCVCVCVQRGKKLTSSSLVRPAVWLGGGGGGGGELQQVL